MTLAETQALFHELLAGDSPVDPARVEACFVGTPGMPAAERVAIYAGMVRGRLEEALRETFPNLHRLLGEASFAALAGDYVRVHPSDHADIGRVGRCLPAFLRRHPDPQRPDLADLASLEWARQEVFFAPSAAAVGAGVLAALAPEDLGRTALVLSPALRILGLAHDVAPAWRRLESGKGAGPPVPGESAVAVWRRDLEVFHCAIPLVEARALASAAAGRPLAEVCAAFVDEEAPATAAHAAISSWLAEGWVVGTAIAAHGRSRRDRRRFTRRRVGAIIGPPEPEEAACPSSSSPPGRPGPGRRRSSARSSPR